MSPAGPHRLADRHFFRASAGADQKEVHQIDRADEEQKKHAGLEQQKRRTNGANVVRMKRDDRRTEAGLRHHLRFRVVFFDRGVVRVDLRLRFCDRRARFQARDHVRAAAAGMARFRSTLFARRILSGGKRAPRTRENENPEAERRRSFWGCRSRGCHGPECSDRN